MIKAFKNNIFIIIGLLVFAIPMLIDSNTDTVALGEFLLIFAVGGILITAVDMIKYHIREYYYRKPENKDEQMKIEAIIFRHNKDKQRKNDAIIFRECINVDGTIDYVKLKERYR